MSPRGWTREDARRTTAGRRTTALGLVLIALALAGAASFSGDDGKAARRMVYPSDFPQGPGSEIAERWCLICHSASLTTQQAKDSIGWEKTLVQMEKWGVALAPAEHDTLLRYLVARLGPRGMK